MIFSFYERKALTQTLPKGGLLTQLLKKGCVTDGAILFFLLKI